MVKFQTITFFVLIAIILTLMLQVQAGNHSKKKDAVDWKEISDAIVNMREYIINHGW